MHYADYEINLECKDSQEQQTWIGHIEAIYNRLQQEIANKSINLDTEVDSTRGEYKSELLPPTLVARLLTIQLRSNPQIRDFTETHSTIDVVNKYMGEDLARWLQKQPKDVVEDRLYVFWCGLICKKTDNSDQVAFLKGKLGINLDIKPIKCVCILLSSRNLVVWVYKRLE